MTVLTALGIHGKTVNPHLYYVESKALLLNSRDIYILTSRNREHNGHFHVCRLEENLDLTHVDSFELRSEALKLFAEVIIQYANKD